MRIVLYEGHANENVAKFVENPQIEIKFFKPT